MARDAVHRARRRDDHRRRDDRQRRRSDDHQGSPHDGGERRVGELDLLAGVRLAADHARARRRHVRPPPAVPRRHDLVRGREHRRRDGVDERHADLRSVPARHRRGDDPARHPVNRQQSVPRQGARDRVRDLGLHDRRHGCDRTVPRRSAHDRPLLALGVPHQRPARHRDRDRPAYDRPGDLGPRHTTRTGPPRAADPDRGPECARVRPDRGPDVWLVARHAAPGPAGMAEGRDLTGTDRLRAVGRLDGRVPADRAGASARRPPRRGRPATVLDLELQPRQRGGPDSGSRGVRPAVRASVVSAGRARAERA